jgi:CRISPR-associated protein Cmr6
MAVYPYHNDLQKVASNMTKGNFGLWYNKFIPIKDFDSCKASDGRGNENNAVLYYYDTYKSIKQDTINKLLDKKHLEQTSFCSALSSRYNTVVFKAKLKTSLITGIGETHPHEVSMVFDYNMGIPYIPASGIKGLVRFAHTLALIADIPQEKIKTDKNGKYFDDEEDWTDVPQLFGTQRQRGSIIFLDAYSEKIPDLHVDIMNPHYGKYYNGESPPADYLDPNPLKFLTVAKDTVFIFRALVDKSSAELIDKVKSAYKKALTEEGVGAKTAVGYGLFEIKEEVEVQSDRKIPHVPKQEVKAIDKYILAIKVLKPTDAGPINSKIDEALIKLESDDDKKAFAQAVKAHMGKAFKKSKAETKLAPFLD